MFLAAALLCLARAQQAIELFGAAYTPEYLDAPEEQMTGMQYRAAFGADEVLVFRFRGPVPMTLHMRNVVVGDLLAVCLLGGAVRETMVLYRSETELYRFESRCDVVYELLATPALLGAIPRGLRPANARGSIVDA